MSKRELSVCPVCLKTIEAQKIEKDGLVYLEKECPEHGFFSTVIWEDMKHYESWGASKMPTRQLTDEGVENGCPRDCGLCGQHRQRTCCILLEVTSRCNLCCPTCFAGSCAEGEDVSLEKISEWYDIIYKNSPGANIQLSGGEPTVRDDLDEIIRLGREKGFKFFQLNTNGLRLGQDMDYLMKLKNAGLSCVFLQFDGFKSETNIKIRGRDVLKEKYAALENCKKAGIGVVLVPVIYPDINLSEVGDIIRFAIKEMPYVTGVHFQPVSYFGRYEGDPTKHVTLPRLLKEIEKQTEGQMKMSDFSCASAENPHCSFNGSFIIGLDGRVLSLEKPKEESCCCCGSGTVSGFDLSPVTAVEITRDKVAKNWSAPVSFAIPANTDPGTLDGMLWNLKNRKLSVSAMAFQDCYSLEISRLQDCYIHVMAPDGRIIPFCAYNLTSINGEYLYRFNKN